MILKNLVAIAILVIAPKAILFMQKKLVQHLESHMEISRAKLIAFFVKLASFFIIGLIVAQTLGIDINTVLGAAGVLTIAVSFSIKTILTNLITGFMVLFEQSIKINDRVLINKIEGTLINIGFLSSTIELKDGTLARIPNGDLLKFPFFSLNAKKFKIIEIEFVIEVIKYEIFINNLEKRLQKDFADKVSLIINVVKVEKTKVSGVVKVTTKEDISNALLATYIAKSIK